MTGRLLHAYQQIPSIDSPTQTCISHGCKAGRHPSILTCTEQEKVMSKYTPDAKEMPTDPNPGVSQDPSVAYDESSNRPRDVNKVTSDKAVGSSESDNRPSKPTEA